ncbi:hypothetical protein HID58_017607 [Brassica napus]|uniref:DCD domain-containing protein n=3 Tax=Brassica napus TaxID=3708 RepID=A0ABQ8D7L5_BRANA|nr:uncharacterized protein LOC106441187 isoform X1 [Brassica napus]XP_048636589.1 uncharacterized protein LOC106441187 isoform X1 [Brassica napus]XP_048636590.1 uncharacterized protein LOC106441187 isoform X1 [Brassica napus]XP_048636591.1 uncharacterized protein LOC106441187 isoform X1 [Brassica napus]XP_048636592.1 uncharacterized protein LOC106441187 isoform X1 [Brassica napus]KAH0925351.1 hypothetical protein HID58_017607 [Brassica napus]CDY31667.1 BnaA05g08800D [Brassica napus]
MAKYRRRKFLEESNGASGEFPEHGAIFMSNSSTRRECLRRELFGLPMGQAGFVKQVKAGMFLFLFEFESRELHGVFQACSDGAINIEPGAFCSTGKQFPAQVKFAEKWRCRPLGEMEFRHAISDNYFTAKKFNFGLSKSQVQRLLKLFSLKKLERSLSTRKLESRLGNADGGRGFRDRRAEETEGDVDRKLPFRVTSAGDARGRRLSKNYGFRDESDSRVKKEESDYSRDASGVFRRLGDPKSRGFEDRNDPSMKNSSRADDDSDYSLANGRRVPKNLSHPASGWPENEYHERDGFTHECNHEEHPTFEEDSAVPAQSSVPPESAYGTNTEHYDPCNPGIMGGAAMESSRHDIDEEPDYYIPMPTEHPQYQTSTGIAGASCSEYESRYGHLGHSQLPRFLASEDGTENMMMNSERPSYPSHSIYPSFAYPLSTDLSPNDGVNYKVLAYQHQEELGGHASYSDDRAARDPRIYPSFAYPSEPGDGVDLYQENRAQNKVQDHQQHEEFGSEAFDSDNRVNRMKDGVSPAEPERKRARKSVFSRLVIPPKEPDAEKDSSPVAEPVNEVMAFLNECQKHLMEQKRPDTADPVRFVKPKKKKEKNHSKEALDNGAMIPFTGTSPDDMSDCEEGVEHKQPFIDFKRRSQAEKSNPTQECKESLEDSLPQDKKRKLLRPRLVEDDSEKDRGNNDNPIETDTAPKPASEVPLLDLLARFGQ